MSDSEKLKPVALKRKAVAHSDKVRYRVYVSPHEFVAVIAENALMAMKLSGVTTPHRIVRDLPLAQNSVEGDRLVPHHLQPTAFLRPDAVVEEAVFQPIDTGSDAESKPFEALELVELHEKSSFYASTIDVSVLLNALPGEVLPAEAHVMEKDPLHTIPMSQLHAPHPGQDLAEAHAPHDPVPGGLSREEVESLLNEPRA